jgi:uncharacterized integral membrane protein
VLVVQITPVWLLGHLSGVFSAELESVAAGLFVAVFCVFAARKVNQAVKDDIGDGSVFLCAPFLCLLQLPTAVVIWGALHE